MNLFQKRTRLPLLVLGVMLLSLTACDESLNPIIESDRQATLWGTLDMNSDKQYLRVVPIRPIIDARFVDPIDVSLKSIDMDTGAEVVWSGSEVTFEDGSVGTIFEADLKLIPEHTYRIEVTSTEFPLITSAETTVPAIPTATVFPEEVSVSTGPSGSVIRGSQAVQWNDLSREPHEIEQWYRFLEFGTVGFFDFELPYVVPNSYEDAIGQLDLALDLKRQYDTLDTKIPVDGLLLVGLGQTLTILDDDLVPPGGVFDPEVLAQPGTMSNVENGFGYVGSVGRFSIEWVIADESAKILTYNPLNGGVRMTEPVGPGMRTATVSPVPWPAEN